MNWEAPRPAQSILDFDVNTRSALWEWVGQVIENYTTSVHELPVAPQLDVGSVRGWVESFTFQEPVAPLAMLESLVPEWKSQQVHTAHPGYFGLFNPAPTQMSIVADALVAAFNPQLAAWSHSPLAVEIERHLVRSIGNRIGFDIEEIDGTFATGGAEANLTALLVALQHRWPETAENGIRALPGQPAFYVSSEGHHSFLKAARACGLGATSLREVPVAPGLAMDVGSLRALIRRDRVAGCHPFLLVATAGTTGAGAIDPLNELADLASEEKLWFHVDAAWGGAAALSPRLADAVSGIEKADSITFDAHKWLSVSMGAGIFITRHKDVLSQTFGTQTAYMPREGKGLPTTDPFTHSIQWSRRFIGLKAFLSLATVGWDGYARVLEHQADMGVLLRQKLAENGWRLVNETPLPVVCFNNAGRDFEIEICQKIVDAVIRSGHAWISTILLGQAKSPAIRACITNFRTDPRHIESLVDELSQARAHVQ
jgi:glutamate/tyrosine decarboxylase-like PLP-dependent enzyme